MQPTNLETFKKNHLAILMIGVVVALILWAVAASVQSQANSALQDSLTKYSYSSYSYADSSSYETQMQSIVLLNGCAQICMAVAGYGALGYLGASLLLSYKASANEIDKTDVE